jgi:amino acid transporter
MILSFWQGGTMGASEHHEGMLPVVESGESVDVAKREDLHKLHGGAVGLAGVLFLTVTGSAPISAMLFNTPLAMGFGNGIGAPAGFIFATIVLTIFSVGYVAMSRKVTAAGGFYSFISHGLGRELGMASGLAMVVAYSVFEVSLIGGFAYFAVAKLNQYGYNPQWYWPAFFMIVLISVLAYFDVHISARILGVCLIGEIVFLLIFDAVVFGHGGNNVQFAALNPLNAFKSLPAGSFAGKDVAAGAAGIGIFFAFWSWVGFEMAPNYGEESKEPKKTVPRAMYISVIGLGIFYTVTSWAAISGYHTTNEAAYISQNQAFEFFFIPAKEFGNEFLKDALSWLIITGSFACGMAFHNTTARYMYSLGREKVLPNALGKTHPKHRSPYIASITQSVIAALIILLFVWRASVDPSTGAAYSVAYIQVYGFMAVMGVVSILAIQALVSVAIFNYFRVHHPEEHHWWTTITAPIIATVSQVAVLYLAISKLNFLAGVWYGKWLCWADLAIFVGGVLYALYLKSNDRAKYETIGRMINSGMDAGPT